MRAIDNDVDREAEKEPLVVSVHQNVKEYANKVKPQS